ncbi:hypothetical protein D3C85_1796050 [compost metagenome]
MIPVEKAFFISGGTIKSPMNGKMAAFSNKSQAKAFEAELKAIEIEWMAIIEK